MNGVVEPPVLVSLDSRGRVTVGKQISKRGLEPAPWYKLSVDHHGILTLQPVTISTPQAVTA